MIRARLTEPIRVVYSRDEALLEWGDTDGHARYCATRDITIIPDAVLAQCAVFVVRPLLLEYEHAALAVSDPGARWRLFAAHVEGAERFSDDHGRDILVRSVDGHRVDDSCRARVPIDLVAEIASVVVRLASVDTTPFFTPPTLSRDRIQYRALRALSALSETASSQAATGSP